MWYLLACTCPLVYPGPFAAWFTLGQEPLVLVVPLLYAYGITPIVGMHDLPWWAYGVMIVSTGSRCGATMTLAHELGHKQTAADRLLARIGNGLIGYGHFDIEHNRGHHVMVSTPEDPAGARRGERIYRFARREMSGSFVRGTGAGRPRPGRREPGIA